MILLFALCASAYGDQQTLNRSLREEAKMGRLSRIDELLKQGAKVNGQSEYGETALYYSVLFGRVKASLKLIEKGARSDLGDELDRTPLLRAAGDCNHKVVAALLKKGADVNRPDFFGRTALINAVESNCVRSVALILSMSRDKVDIDAQDNSFRSALDYADHPWIVQMLQEAINQRASSDPASPVRGAESLLD